MKGIILAGGSGSRLSPLTIVTNKQLLPVYDKPMIYYPLSTLMLAGIQDILLISTPEDTQKFERLLKDGSQFGIRVSYAVQPSPGGLAQAFLIGESFLQKSPCAMILGDNFFHGNNITGLLRQAKMNALEGYATIFGYYVNDPTRFGIVEFSKNMDVISIEEKPIHPKSNYCVTGLYFYDERVTQYAKELLPSERGELEITSLNQMYVNSRKIRGYVLGRGFTWMDMGTIDSLMDTARFVQMTETRQGIAISAPEEIAFRNGWITKETLLESAQRYGTTAYGKYLCNVAGGKIF